MKTTNSEFAVSETSDAQSEAVSLSYIDQREAPPSSGAHEDNNSQRVSSRLGVPARPSTVPPEILEEMFDSVAQVDAAAWDQVRDPEAIFLDLRLLRALELSMSESSRFRYLIYRTDSGEPLAIAVLCTFIVDIGVLANDRYTRWILKQLGKISRKLVDYKILFCGLPLSACQSSLAFAPHADPVQILAQLDRTMRRVAKDDGSHVLVFKEFADEELPNLQSLESAGYRRADSLPTHHVQLLSSTFEGYLQDVGSKRRRHFRHSMNRFAKSGIVIITTSDVATIERLFTTETQRLYEAVLSRSATQLEHLTSEFFLQIARQLPDCCVFQFALRQEKVVGFSISLKSGSCYRALFIGLDYEINREVHLYFNMLFRVVSDALAVGASSIEMGQNSDQLKQAKLGACQSRRSVYVRGRGMLMNALIGLLFHQLFPPRPLLNETENPQAECL